MKTVVYQNGYVGTWDDTITAGDIITTYNKGYFEFVSCQHRVNMTPLFTYTMKYDAKGNLKNGKKIYVCDASYCAHARTKIDKQIAEYQTIIDNLRNIH